ncbi:MAG: glycosyltransferase family 39 protein [Hyphomicrobiales bacterium]
MEPLGGGGTGTPKAGRGRRRAGPALVAIAVAVGLLVRLALIAAHPRDPVSDQAEYDRIARTILAEGRYAIDGNPTAFRPPGYPFFVAAVYGLAGASPGAVKVVQAVLDVLTALLLFLLLRRRNPRAAPVAAGVWALYPPAIVYAHLLLSETLYVFLLVGLSFLLVEERTTRPRGAVAAGVVAGLATLVKPQTALALLLLPALASRSRQPFPRYGIVLATALLVVAPWVVRNALVLGAPTLSTSVGPNLLVGNHPNATGGYAPDVPPTMRPRGRGEVEAGRESAAAALRYATSHPAIFAWRVPLRWAHLLMGEAELAVTSFAPQPDGRSSRFRAKVRALAPWVVASLWVPFALVLLAGAVAFLASPDDRLGTLFASILLAWLVVHGVTYGGSRYHEPWMPFLALYAATFAAAPRETLASLTRCRAGALLLFVAACVAVWSVEVQAYGFHP